METIEDSKISVNTDDSREIYYADSPGDKSGFDAWVAINLETTQEIVSVTWQKPNALYLMTSNGTIYLSVNKGISFTQIYVSWWTKLLGRLIVGLKKWKPLRIAKQ